MRAPTSVTVFIAGAILAFAISGHPGFLDLKMAGGILMATGVLGLWPLGGKFWVLLGRARLRRMLDESAPVEGVRVPLDELFSHQVQGARVPLDELSNSKGSSHFPSSRR